MLESLDRNLLAAFGGDQNHGDVSVCIADPLYQFQAVDVRHLQIRDDHIGHDAVGFGNRVGAVVGVKNAPVRFFRKQAADQSSVDRVIVYDKYFGHENITG